MLTHRSLALVATLLTLSACYHATIETGLAPGVQILEKSWAAGWIYGLVPPSTVETMQRCPDGVARVETQLSFPNQLVSFLTLGIFTPMKIVVTCAGSRGASMVTNKDDFETAVMNGAPFLVQVGQVIDPDPTP